LFDLKPSRLKNKKKEINLKNKTIKKKKKKKNTKKKKKKKKIKKKKKKKKKKKRTSKKKKIFGQLNNQRLPRTNQSNLKEKKNEKK